MAAVFVPTIGRFPSCLRWSLVVSLIQFNSVPPRPCLPSVAQASSDLAEGVERSLRLEVALEPDRVRTRNNNPEVIIILSNREV